jgi:hypothetical protein
MLLTFYSTFYEYLFTKQMPSSYLASKPPPNPGLPNWLTWTKNDFSKIDPDSPQVAALVGINRISELVVIYKPVPIIGPDVL